MPNRPRNDNLQKHTLSLFCGDYRKLQDHYPELGAAIVIRKLVRNYLEGLEQPQDKSVTEVEAKV